MQSFVSRPQPLGSGTSSSHRVPRKSTSFLSLRREKDKTPAQVPYTPAYDPSAPTHNARSTYFDAYPRPKSSPNTARPSKSKARRTSPPRGSDDAPASSRRDMWERPSVEPVSYTFPSLTSGGDIDTAPITPKQYTRTRSRTGPSGRSNWEDNPLLLQLCFSGSSSTQHTETPPHTPIDFNLSRESFEHFPVMVAAPVSGVETMDALVDGMNGGDDILGGRGISNRARFGIPGHHPLYLPPLPTPPPGIVLGGGKARRARPQPVSSSSRSGDSEDDSDHLYVPNTTSRPRRRTTRPSSSRTASNSTITPLRAASHTSLEDTIITPSYLRSEATPRKPTAPAPPDRQKTVIPSISDIIRTHAPPGSQVRSRPSTGRSSSLYAHSQGHASLQEEPESEPEPLTAEEEAELMSRSSIDSVADEVRRTLRNQVIMKPTPTPPPSSFMLKRHSTISDNASICSPRSEPGAGSSIYSSSAASTHQPPSPFDTSSFLSMVRPSPSQAVAQYLRSARLTTLLKLTRSPHASQDNPLTVSLSDLGSPSGFPVVVFLGLGCVRHIMGLYDEMAECLGLRLITIDR